MSPYTPLDAFTTAEIYDLSDLVKGGSSGDANTPIEALFDRTNYLYNRLRRWEAVEVLTDNYTWNNSDLGKLLKFQITDNKTFTLPDVTTLTAGTRIAIITSINVVKSLTVQSVSAQPILDGSISWVSYIDNTTPAIYMHDGEKLILVAASDHWEVELALGNFYNAGESFGARKQMKNTLITNGLPFTRADCPRLSLFAGSLILGQTIFTDATWLSDPGGIPMYRGAFSQGNGTTTYRLPDERGMSDRYLDLSRGIDLSRSPAYAGGYEKDQVGEIKFNLIIPKGNTSQDQNGVGNITSGGSAQEPQDLNPIPVTINANKETIVKNIGKIPLIRY